MEVKCNHCNTVFDAADEGGKRMPCPNCGKTTRIIEESIRFGTKVNCTFQGEVIRHWTRLLENAQRLHENGGYEVAVVVAQTACEVIVERAMGKAFDKLQVSQLEPWVLPKRFSYSLANENSRKLYRTLTGDDNIASEPFWHGYTTMTAIRNKSVHSGAKVSEMESRDGLDAARKLVEHIEQHNSLA